jgi:hypothetical protein
VASSGRVFKIVFVEVHAGTINAQRARSTLRTHISIAAGATGARVSATSDATFRGLPAVRGRGTYHNEPMTFLAFAVNNAEYGLIVHAKTGGESALLALEQQMQVRRS